MSETQTPPERATPQTAAREGAETPPSGPLVTVRCDNCGLTAHFPPGGRFVGPRTHVCQMAGASGTGTWQVLAAPLAREEAGETTALTGCDRCGSHRHNTADCDEAGETTEVLCTVCGLPVRNNPESLAARRHKLCVPAASQLSPVGEAPHPLFGIDPYVRRDDAPCSCTEESRCELHALRAEVQDFRSRGEAGACHSAWKRGEPCPRGVAAALPAAAPSAERLDEFRKHLNWFSCRVYGSADDSYPTTDEEVAEARAPVEAFVASLLARVEQADAERERLTASLRDVQAAMHTYRRAWEASKAQAAQLAADRERLDWIEAEAARSGHGSLNSVRLSPAFEKFPAECEVNRYAQFAPDDDVQTFTGADIRAAIDAARTTGGRDA